MRIYKHVKESACQPVYQHIVALADSRATVLYVAILILFVILLNLVSTNWSSSRPPKSYAIENNVDAVV